MTLDKRRMRVWVKVQLDSKPDAQHVGEIIAYWKRLRSAAFHLQRAIRMYYALTLGDSSLLQEYFPFIMATRGLPPITPVQVPVEPPRAVQSHKTEDEDLSDFFSSMGFD